MITCAPAGGAGTSVIVRPLSVTKNVTPRTRSAPSTLTVVVGSSAARGLRTAKTVVLPSPVATSTSSVASSSSRPRSRSRSVIAQLRTNADDPNDGLRSRHEQVNTQLAADLRPVAVKQPRPIDFNRAAVRRVLPVDNDRPDVGCDRVDVDRTRIVGAALCLGHAELRGR